MEVQVISRKLITPSVPTPPHLQNLKISFFDQIAPSTYIHNIFYYPNNHGIIKKTDQTVLNQQLEKSLSEILTLFYPLAGRYIQDNLSVNCNDQGVEFLEAKVDVDLTKILQQEPINPELLGNFIPFVKESDTSPLLAIQINKFRCGGLAIGLQTSHRIADITTFSAFINAWATTFREGGICDQVYRPNFDPMHLFPQRDLKLPPPPPETYPNVVTKVFVFNKETIEKLKYKIRGVDSAGVELRPSRSDVVIGIIWRALVDAAKAHHGHLRASSLCLMMNLRGRLGMPLPENACGNIYMPFLSRFDANDSKLELSHFVSLIRDAKRKAISDCAKAVDSDGLFSMVTNSYRELVAEYSKVDIDKFCFSSWCRVDLEEADFGWGKPAWVSLVRLPSLVSCVKDDKSGDGIEAWMSLEEINRLQLQQDPHILALTSSQE